MIVLIWSFAQTRPHKTALRSQNLHNVKTLTHMCSTKRVPPSDFWMGRICRARRRRKYRDKAKQRPTTPNARGASASIGISCTIKWLADPIESAGNMLWERMASQKIKTPTKHRWLRTKRTHQGNIIPSQDLKVSNQNCWLGGKYKSEAMT